MPRLPEDLLTSPEAAKLLKVGEQTLRLWRMKRIGPPFVKLTDQGQSPVRYRRGDLQEWITAMTVRTDPVVPANQYK